MTGIKTDSSLYINLPLNNINLVNACNLVQKVECDLMNHLHEYELYYQLDLSKLDTRKLFTYYILKSVCDFYISYKQKEKVVLVYNVNDLSPLDPKLIEILPEYKIFITKIIKSIISKMPIVGYVSSIKFNRYETINRVGNGTILDHIAKIKATITKCNNKTYSFRKIGDFSKRYELNYLTKEYFNKLKMKSLLIK